MGFKWLCPACGHVNDYKGNKITNVVVRCLVCKEDIKASSHIYEEKLPKLPEKLPRTTEYKTVIKASKSTAEVNLDYWEDMANWAINTIKNKPQVKTGKGQYFRNVERWSEQLAIIKKLKEEVEK